MKNKIQNVVIAVSFLAVLLFLSVSGIILPDNEISYSERRKLATFPQFSAEKLWKKDPGGKGYFDAVEEYLLDQFPVRDAFRTLNVSARKYAFMQKDINGIYTVGNRIFKMDYVLNEQAVERSADVYLKVIDKYFSENSANIYYTIVPDKNYYSAKANGYLSLDYDKMFGIMEEKLAGYSFIDIRNLLSEEDYYRTDLHWEQQKITDVANALLEAMGEAGNVNIADYEEKRFEGFEGAYYGQAALPIEPDDIVYLTNDMLENCKIFDYETGKYVSMYAEEKLGGVDSYDVYLYGAKSLITIENPGEGSGKELVIFRDSFGSSLAPLLTGEYSKITLVDIRYINSNILGRLLKVSDNCDVLFMYNTGTLNTLGQGSIS